MHDMSRPEIQQSPGKTPNFPIKHVGMLFQTEYGDLTIRGQCVYLQSPDKTSNGRFFGLPGVVEDPI